MSQIRNYTTEQVIQQAKEMQRDLKNNENINWALSTCIKEVKKVLKDNKCTINNKKINV